jgi:hypothetical protein
VYFTVYMATIICITIHVSIVAITCISSVSYISIVTIVLAEILKTSIQFSS